MQYLHYVDALTYMYIQYIYKFYSNTAVQNTTLQHYAGRTARLQRRLQPPKYMVLTMSNNLFLLLYTVAYLVIWKSGARGTFSGVHLKKCLKFNIIFSRL